MPRAWARGWSRLEPVAAALTTPRPQGPAAAAQPVRTFDGVICFGGVDWWYHNRGHYDLQMMRELSAHVPVLYVNSIGMRVPRPGKGGMFAKRVLRKLKSFSHGLTRVREDFWVLSPVVAPAGLGASMNEKALALQVRRAARQAGISRPLVWVACPPGQPVVDALEPVGVVYQRTDRFEEFKGVDRDRIARFDRLLKERADVTLFCSSWLMDQERDQPRESAFVDHGVDFQPFLDAGMGDTPPPEDTRALKGPIVGFVGGIDAHTFDPELFVEVARRVPEATFMLVGGCSLPEGWCELPNVTMLGQRPYDQVPGYMAAADVLIMPWNRSEWIRACNPVKLKEYLAVGRPIVSTPFPELERYQGLVRVGETAEEFAQEIRASLRGSFDPGPGRERVREQTWTAKANAVLDALAYRDIEAEGPTMTAVASTSTAKVPRDGADGGWTPGRFAWLFVLLALAVLAGLPSWQNVFGLALRSDEYSHMLLVLPVVGILLWQRREDLVKITPRFSLAGPVIAAAGAAMDFVGFASQIDLLKDLGMIAMVLGAIVTVTGLRWVLSAKAAFAAMLFLVPVPGRVRQQISLPLQEGAAVITQWILELFGQPIIRHGNVLVINGIDVGVAEACNGMRMVLALALVSYAFVFIVPLRPWVRVVILLATPVVALIANVSRLGPNVLFYGYTNDELAKFAHDVSGWLVLLVALGVLWGFVALCRWMEIPIEPAREGKP